MMTAGVDQILSTVRPVRQALLEHPIYEDLRSAPALRTFMEYHVFAVWDFMSLLKSLQQRFCCVSLPWLPKGTSLGSRFVNEIVLGEETDDDGKGGYASHFELYHRAMTEFGAGTARIDRFLAVLQRDIAVHEALLKAELPEPIQRFVGHTFDVIETGDVCRIASAFTFGREDLLPEVFSRIVAEIGQTTGGRLETFDYYLRRHIQLDADEHGPMAARLITSICGADASKWKAAGEAAAAALEARLALWNGIHVAVKGCA